MKQIDDKKILEQNVKIEEALVKERDEWNTKFMDLVQMLKDTKKLSEAQVYQLSYRQQVQERLATYRNLLEKKQENLDIQMRDRFREYSISYDLKLNGTEKSTFCNADCVALRQQVALIKNQIIFFEESIKTLDNFGFAVRNKLEIIAQQLI